MLNDLDTPRIVLLVLGGVVLVAIGVAAATSPTAFGAYNPAWDGAWEIRGIAETGGAEVTTATNVSAYDDHPPNTSVAVVLSPTEPYSPAEVARIDRFVRNGGRVVIAGDFGSPPNALLAGLGVETRIDGRLVRDEHRQFRTPAMPRAVNVTEDPLTRGVDRLTLNFGSVLQPGVNATVLVRTSEYAYLDADRDGELDDNESVGAYPVAAREEVGAGSVVVVSDPSAFINVMLDEPGNRRFIANLVAREHVLLDYSHAGGVPPLIFAVLALRRSVLLQLGLGGVGLGAIALWGFAPDRVAAIRDRFSRDPDPAAVMDREAMVAYLARRYPEWDRDRLERIVRGLHDEGDDAAHESR